MKDMKKLNISITLLLLSGCASNNVWVRDNTSGGITQQDFSQCKYDAEKNGFVPMGFGTSAISAGVQQGVQTAELMNKCMSAKGYYLKNKKELERENSLFEGINKLIAQKDYDKALNSVNQIILSNMRPALAYYYRGHINFGLEDYQASINDFNKSESLGLNDVILTVYKSVAFVKTGEPDIAIEVVNQKLDGMKDAKLYNARAYALNAKQNFDDAISDTNKAIALDSANHQPYKNKGVAYIGKGLYEDAIKEFNKSLSLLPSYGWAYAGRGDARKELNQIKAAEADFRKACDLGIKSYCNI
jgi:tetratricopeptide (TPR) repeat protein